MKRLDDVMGRPSARVPRRDVAGASWTGPATDVASFRHAIDDPMATAVEDAALIQDFADFLAGEAELDAGALPPPDPAFRERLRRKLWRAYSLTHLRDGGETH